MKRSILAVLITIFAVAFLTGCQAFKDHYNPIPQEVVQKVENAAVPPAEGEEPKPEEPKPVDYTTDKNICDHVSTITVTAAESGEGVNDGWTAEKGDTEEVTVLAEKLGDFTTRITIQKNIESLSFTIKQTDEKIYNVCSVVLTGCVGECLGVSSIWAEVAKGTLELYKFMSADGEKVINSGKYSFTFDVSSLGDEGRTLDGGYASDHLGTPATTVE